MLLSQKVIIKRSVQCPAAVVLRVVPGPEASASHRNLLETHFGVPPVVSEAYGRAQQSMFAGFFTSGNFLVFNYSCYTISY